MATSAAYIDLDEGAAPATPAAGKVRVYAKTDGSAYQKDDAGTETGLAGGGSGGAAPNLYIGTAPYWLAAAAAISVTANRANLARFVVHEGITVDTVHFRVGTQSGNLDFGIYDDTFALLGSTGSFACPASGAATQALSAPTDLPENSVVYLAWAGSSGTLTLRGVSLNATNVPSGWNLYGREESAFPLPSSIASVDAWEDSVHYPIFYFS